MVYNMLNTQDMDEMWRNKVPFMKPEEIHINTANYCNYNTIIEFKARLFIFSKQV